MRKSTFISMIALLVALAGVVIALAAYFKRKRCVLCDDFEDDLLDEDSDDLDYYSAPVEDHTATDDASSTAAPEQPVPAEEDDAE